MKRVVVVVHYPVFGGPHNQVLRLDAELARRGWQTTLVLTDELGNAADRLRHNGIRVVQIPLERVRATGNPFVHGAYVARLWRDVSMLRELLVAERADLVQITGLVNPQGAIAGRLARVPVVWQLLDTRAPVFVRKLLMPVVNQFADCIMSTGVRVALSHSISDRVKDRLVLYAPPVDTRLFCLREELRAQARSELALPRDAVCVGSVANLNPQKGLDFLLEAAARVCKRYPNVYFRILGATTASHRSYERALRGKIAESGLEQGGRALIANPEDRVHELIQAFDIFAFSPVPRSEGISTVVLEAMSSRLPVVCTAVGSIPEVVDQGRTGLLVESGHLDEFVESISLLVTHTNLRNEMGIAARLECESSFSLSSCADAHVRAYELATRRVSSSRPKKV